MTENAEISVIVPVYNVSRFLSECLDSILAQTFENFELICVDDGSTDGSEKILDGYALKDKRVRVIHKENGGYGSAMNVGMERAAGRYIAIVESDDMILPDFLETLYLKAAGDDLDIVKSEPFFWLPGRNYRFRYHGSARDGYFGRILSRDRIWLRCQFLMNTWSGLYKREFIRNCGIRHHESPGASFQDNGFWMQGMIFAEKVMVIDYAGYMYRQDNESASIKDTSKVYAMSDEYAWLSEELKDRVSDREMDIINSFRLIRGYRNLFRIEDRFMRDFCDRLIKDYESYGDVFYKDIIWQDRFEKLRDDPDGLCAEITGRRKEAADKLEKAGSLIIYGAGSRGERLFRLLCFHGWGDKLQCFIETDTPAKETVGDKPVYRKDDDMVDYENALVIISPASDRRSAKEMEQNVKDREIMGFMRSEDLIDVFYMIC